MLVQDHIRIAAWIGAGTRNRVVLCDEAPKTKDVTDDDRSQTARDQANEFAQLRRLAHHRFQLWKRQQRVHRPVSIAKVAVCESIEELPATPEPESIGNGDFTQDRLDAVALEKIPDESKQNHELELSSTLQLATAEGGDAAATHELPAVSESSAVQDEVKKCQDELLRDPDPVLEESIRPFEQENPEHCDQLDSQIDETHTAKETHTVGSARAPHEDGDDSPATNTLSAVGFMDSPSLSAWASCEDTNEHHMRLLNVKFRGCERSGLELMPKCEFVNVKFVNCKFNRTTFLDVKLSNVTFSHNDFTDATFYCLVLRNVTITKVHFKNDVWRNTYLENALVDEHNFKSHPKRKREYGLTATLASSKTQRSLIGSALTRDELKQKVCCNGAWRRDIYLCEPVSAADILTRLSKHKAVIDRIMQYCFPGPSVHVYEYPDGISIPGKENLAKGHDPREEKRPPHRGQQFVYSVVDANSLKRQSGRHLTTYFGSMAQETPKVSEVPTNLPRRGTGGSTALLRVNKAISEQSLKYLYRRTLHLQCSPVGAKEFLIRHRRQMELVEELVLYFHWEADGVAIRTDLDTDPWRHLHNTIRHEFSFIPAICIHVGQKFWCHHSRWTKGAELVLRSDKSPFSLIAKIAAPEHRSQYRWMAPEQRTNGTSLKISIDGTEGRERTEFVQSLVEEIEKERAGRPLFVGEVKYQCAKDVKCSQ